MAWNYRIVKLRSDIEASEDVYSIAEVYWSDGKKLVGWCERQLVGNDVEDLEAGYNLIGGAFKKEPLYAGKDNILYYDEELTKKVPAS